MRKGLRRARKGSWAEERKLCHQRHLPHGLLEGQQPLLPDIPLPPPQRCQWPSGHNKGSWRVEQYHLQHTREGAPQARVRDLHSANAMVQCRAPIGVNRAGSSWALRLGTPTRRINPQLTHLVHEHGKCISVAIAPTGCTAMVCPHGSHSSRRGVGPRPRWWAGGRQSQPWPMGRPARASRRPRPLRSTPRRPLHGDDAPSFRWIQSRGHARASTQEKAARYC